MVIWIPFLVALIGALVYLAAQNSKAAELGRAAWWTGLLAGLLLIGHTSVSILH